MPVQALWGGQGVVGRQFDCLSDRREVASRVTGHALDCGHFLPEEAPRETLDAIARFILQHPIREAAA
jgi:haloacetate dehalogenase